MKRREIILVIIIAIVSGMIGGATSIWFLLAKDPTKPVQVIKAEKFEIVNQYGKTIGTFSADRHGASLSLCDSAGRLRGQFSYHGVDFNRGHTYMKFYGNNENLKLQLGVFQQESPIISLYGSNGSVQWERATR